MIIYAEKNGKMFRLKNALPLIPVMPLRLLTRYNKIVYKGCNAALICTENTDSGVITKSSESTSADFTVKTAENPASAGPTDMTSSRIDENGHVFPWIALLSVCSGILVGIAVVSKVKKKAE